MYENIHFPGWEVVQKIGEGSFGGVYEIHRTLPDGRVEKAALKKLTVPKDNIEIRELYSQSFSRETITAHYKEQVRELAKEYTLTQELNSCKNVVACHDVQCVQHTDGIGWDIYIRMELLRPLKLVLSTDYQEMAVLKLGLSLCNALLACQKHHIVHRDIKPENILVSDRGEFKLGDFGIAKVSEKTATGTMTGTMGYMAPEVANRWHYGAQADIYSLGMVLYWMMNRRTLPFLPFPPAIPTAAQRQEAANRRFAGESFPPPVNGSRELKAIVMKACAFSTEDRYQTVRELSRDLYACYQQRRAGKNHDVSIPLNTDEAVWTNESTLGNTYSGSRIIHSNSQNEKTGTLNPDTRKAGTLKTDVTKTDTSKTGRSPTPPEKPRKRRTALICVLVALCLCFASITGYLLMYGVRLAHQSASAPETINRMQSDPFDEDTDDTDTLQVFLSGILRKDVASITFLDMVADAPEDAWDVSEDGDGSVLAWMTGEAPAYDLYIAGEGGVRAPKNCLGLFAGYANATSITFGTAFDTSEAADMTYMFALCEKLTALDVHSFDTSHVANMKGMFGGCSGLSSLDVSSFDTSLVTDMSVMFYGCGSLTGLDLRSFDTSHVINMTGMFDECLELSNLDVSSFDTSLVTDMSYMFNDCGSLTALDLRNFDTSHVTNMTSMFSTCFSLRDLDTSSFDTSLVTDMSYMFTGLCLTDLDVSSFDTSSVTDMSLMFHACIGLTDLDIRNFDTSHVTNMDGMFYNCTSLENLAVDSFDTSLVYDMSYMFYGCDSLTDLDLSSFDFSNVESYECFMNDYRLYNGQRWEELFANGSGDNSFRSQPTLAAGAYHTVGLCNDGTVVAAEWNDEGQCDVNSWTDIVAVAAGYTHTVGLRSDGTVVATGNNGLGQCSVDSWTNIVAVAAEFWHTVGLRSDGTVVAAGWNDEGQCDVNSWTDIVAVAAGQHHTVGLRSDGTVVATGENEGGQCDVNNWTDIVAVAAGAWHTVGLRSDGTVVATGSGSESDVDSWTDIVAVATGEYHTVGLRRDGTVVATGDNNHGQCSVDSWTDIVAVAARWGHTVGLRSDGTVVAAGRNDYGQCDVSGWKNIRLPQ